MAYRKRITNIGLDQKIFGRTAKKTKKINVEPKPTRGGGRL